MTLRPYQQDALDALRKGWADGKRNLGVALPTGTGKTHIMATLGSEEAADLSDSRRVMYLLHRDTLVEQTAAKLRTVVPADVSVGILKAERNETGARIIIASVHSLRNAKRREALPPIKLCVVDEAHVSVSPTYLAVFEQLGAGTPEGARLAGFSATWTRSDDRGLGDIWEEIVYQKSIQWGVKNGFLVKPRAIQVGEGVDLADVRSNAKGDDYREDDLGRAVMLEELRENAIQGFLKHDNGSPAVLFAPTVEAAEYFGDGLRDAGVPTAGLYGKTAAALRRLRFHDHREGRLRVLTTCTALAEGWDCPPAALGLLVRPTRHEGLFVQMIGRFLRPWPGKTEALLLDLVRATDDVKLRNAVDLSKSVFRDQGELEELLEEEEPAEPVTRERIVHRRKGSYEIELFPGATVQWLMGPSGVPFVPCGNGLVFIVEDRDGWAVAVTSGGWTADGRPMGRFSAQGLDQADALEYASEIADDYAAISKKKAPWRKGRPSEKQKNWARALGCEIDDEMTSGMVSDAIAVARATPVLNYFATWSRSRLEGK